jgi:hypothetical protein
MCPLLNLSKLYLIRMSTQYIYKFCFDIILQSTFKCQKAVSFIQVPRLKFAHFWSLPRALYGFLLVVLDWMAITRNIERRPQFLRLLVIQFLHHLCPYEKFSFISIQNGGQYYPVVLYGTNIILWVIWVRARKTKYVKLNDSKSFPNLYRRNFIWY